MKAEKRHQLQRNVLADQMGRLLQGMRSSSNTASGLVWTFVILTLPHTGVRVVIPLVRYHLAVKPPTQPGRGVKPDIEIGSAPALNDQAGPARLLARPNPHER